MKKALIVSTVSQQFTLFERGNIELLHNLGFEIHCAANYKSSNKSLDDLNIIRHHFDISRSPFSFANINAYKQLNKLIVDIQPDLIHCHSPMGGVLTRFAAGKARRRGAKVLYTAHGFHFYDGSPLFNWYIYFPVEKICSYMTDAIITLNYEDFALANKKLRSVYKYYLPGIGVNVDNIRNKAVDVKLKRSDLGIPESAKIIIHVGEFIKRKNHKTLLKAFARLTNKSDKYLLLCGKGELQKDLEKLSEELGVKDRVIFAGYRRDVIELLKSSDCFAFPSFQEGLPVSMMEAMASGVPVVCSRIRGNVDLITEGIGGFLLEPNDVNGFAKAITTILSNDNLAGNMRKKNLEKMQQYDAKNVNNEMIKIYTRFSNCTEILQ